MNRLGQQNQPNNLLSYQGGGLLNRAFHSLGARRKVDLDVKRRRTHQPPPPALRGGGGVMVTTLYPSLLCRSRPERDNKLSANLSCQPLNRGRLQVTGSLQTRVSPAWAVYCSAANVTRREANVEGRSYLFRGRGNVPTLTSGWTD